MKRTITIKGLGDDTAARQADERNNGVIHKNYAPFTENSHYILHLKIMWLEQHTEEKKTFRLIS